MTLKDLAQPSTTQWLFRAAINWIEILLIFMVMAKLDHVLVHFLGIFILGTRLHALALLGHEAIHRNISHHKGLNNFIGSMLASLPLFQTLNLFKKFHLDHHGYIQSPKDPEIHFRSQTPQRWSLPLSKMKRLGLFLLDLSGIGYLESRHVLYITFKNLNVEDFIFPFIYWSTIVFISLKFNAGWIPLYWTIAFVTSYWAMFRQRALTEHLGTSDTHKLKANFIQRFLYLPHNTWYHYEHHRYPNVPCWNLPKVRALGEEVMSVNELFQKMEGSKP